MKEKLINFFYSKNFILGIALLFATIATIQQYSLGTKRYGVDKNDYTHYNNYVIFKTSFEHLKEEKGLYQSYPDEHWDLFKYTPTFSLFMAPFYYLPDFLGLWLWNVLNVGLLIWALLKLPLRDKRMYLWIFGFIVFDLVLTTQNTQSNALIAGLILMAYNCLRERKDNLAILLVCLAVITKPYAILGFIPFLFFPNLWQNALKSVSLLILMIILPMILVSGDYLIQQYESWLDLLAADQGGVIGYSLMGWLQKWFGIEANKSFLQIFGFITLLLPLSRFAYFKSNYFQLNYLALILIWMVVFNHMAESPTFIIAVTGVGIWFFHSKKSIMDITLFVLACIFTVLITTEFFPRSLRDQYMEQYSLKGVPTIFIYFKLLWDLMRYQSDKVFKKAVN